MSFRVGKSSPTWRRVAEQLLANDARAEASVLGAILHNPAVFADLTELQAHHFYMPVHALLFTTLLGMYNDAEEIAAATVFARLKGKGEFKKVGGAPYLSALLQAFKSASNVTAYAQIVIDQWRLRQLKALSDRFGQLHDMAAVDEIPRALAAARKFLDEADLEGESGDDGFDAAYESWVDWYDRDQV